MTQDFYSYKAEVSNVAEQLRIWSESGSRPDEWLLREWAQRLKVVSDGLDGPSLPHPDTARMDFMEGFIVEGSHLSSGKTAWLADVECLRECIDEGMRVVQERRDATGTPQEKP